MSRSEGSRNALITITYDTIAELVGSISGDTARQYAHRGQFDPHDLESVFKWINTRRAGRGLAILGAHDGVEHSVINEQRLSAANNVLRYNPARGCYEEDWV